MNLSAIRSSWQRLRLAERVALVAVAAALVLWGLGLPGRLVSFLRFLAYPAAGYLLFRGLVWLRREGLWSLRNRLLVAYLFIAVVPVLLLIGMAWLSAYIIYAQLGAHLLQTDLQKRIDRVASVAETVADAVAPNTARAPILDSRGLLQTPEAKALVESAGRELPGLRVETGVGAELLDQHGGASRDRFAGLTQEGDQILLRAVVARKLAFGRLVVSASAPVTEGLLSGLAPELGIVQLTVWRPAGEGGEQKLVFESGGRRFELIKQIAARNRMMPARAGWLDFEVAGTCKFEAVPMKDGRPEAAMHPVFAPFSARASQLNQRLFSSLGELGGVPIQLLVLVGVVFLIIEVVALRTGIQLTRSITHAVDDLSRATQSVQAGDLSHTVNIHQRDQLGALGESFNEMIASISTLIEEQRQRQRLENELSIAREVQGQLFPQSLPSLPGIELAAICRAARVVSGDYYDFIRLGPNQLGMAIADISGKGISAALLMASLQAALRSQVLLGPDSWRNTAALVARLNLHLFLNSSADRYATLFYAVYDGETQTLHYTNAGHLPPFYLIGDQVTKLEEGGMVVGLFDDCTYEQGTVPIQPGSLLVAYSDGLIESENVYGEQFSAKNLLQEVVRRRNDPPQKLAEGLVQAAEEWAGTPEQADDMTVIVARLG